MEPSYQFPQLFIYFIGYFPKEPLQNPKAENQKHS